MNGKEGNFWKLLRQNLRGWRGLAALGVLSAAYWASQRNTQRNGGAASREEGSTSDLGKTPGTSSDELLRIDHAMRTPIGAARAALAILQSATEDPELQAEALRVIDRQLARMTALTEELREFAQRQID